MRKLFLLLMMFAAIATTANAQKEALSTITLKNGVSIQGFITERSNGYVNIKTTDGDIFVYRENEIQRIAVDPAVKEAMKKAEKEAEKEAKRVQKEEKEAQEKAAKAARKKRIEEKYGFHKGYKGIIEAGGGCTQSMRTHTETYWTGTKFVDTDYWGHHTILNTQIISLTMTNGYNFTPHFYLGFCTGVNVILDHETAFSIPFLIDMRIPFAKNRIVTPFLGLKAGYNLNIKDSYYISTSTSEHWWEYDEEYKINEYTNEYSYNDNGCYIEPMLGLLDIKFNKRKSLFISFCTPMTIGEEFHWGLTGKIGFSF